MPAQMLCNGRVGEPGNADWAATLARSLGPRWTFDEYHHGLTGATEAAAGQVRTERFLDLYLLQVVFLYMLAVLALGRRFGPAWREPAVVSGSVANFLVGLGGLHARHGHHADAAAALVARATELDRRLTVAEAALRRGQGGPREFVELAQSLAGPGGRKRG
jgi:hypothetical protein